MAGLKITELKKLADEAGISIGASESSPYPTLEQLKAFTEGALQINRLSPSEARTRAIKLAKKHKLFKGKSPVTIGEEWAVDAIAEALLV